MTGAIGMRCAWLVNPFDPVPGSGLRPMRYEAIAHALAATGWDVVWFTADFDHTSRTRRVPHDVDRMRVAAGIRLEFVHVPSYRRTVGAARLRSHRAYVRGLAVRMRALADVPPAVVLVSVPLVGALRAALLLRGRCGGAVVADVQDVWPEAIDMLLPAPLRVGYRPLRSALLAHERRLLAQCDGVVAVSETYLERRGGAGTPGLCAYLGVDLPAATARIRAAEHPTTFLWNGTIRPAADLATVVEAAALLRRRDVRARFVIAGDGPPRAGLERRATRLGLGERVCFLGAYPEAERGAIVGGSDVGLHAYVPDAVISLTNKFFDYQAAGLAILNSLPGEAARLVDEHGMGINYRGGDPESLAAAVAVLVHDPARTAAMGSAARRFAESVGSRAASATRIADFLDRIAGGMRAVA